MKKVLQTVKKVLIAAFLVLPIVLIVYVMAANIAGEIPTLFGYSTNIVITPSMSDVLPVGSVILSKSYKEGDPLEVGQIVTYLGDTGSFDGKLITHKIESITETEEGTVIVTKGTQNTSADPEISPANIKSVLVCKLINLGKFYELIRTPVGFLFILVIPILALIGYEVWNFKRTMSKEKESLEYDSEHREHQS